MEPEKIYTVSLLNNELKELIGNILPQKITVNGEISNFKIANNNLFVTLKDDESNLNVVSWGYGKYKNKIDLQNGDKINVTGKISIFNKSSNINLIATNITKVGLGELHAEYEKIKTLCVEKGYFNDAHKKQLPKVIKNLCIITAPEGAAIQDILYVLKTNKFVGNIVIKRCIVQGSACVKSLLKSIKFVELWKDSNGRPFDVLLITRGGGSFEDLMGFSDLRIVEAIHNVMKKTNIFVISAVGHEVDFMLSDFVADMRAPTPSIAGEIISQSCSKINDHLKNISNYNNHVKNLILKRTAEIDLTLNTLKFKLISPIKYIEDCTNNLNDIMGNLIDAMHAKINCLVSNLSCLEKRLQKYDVDNNLNDGYALILCGNKLIDTLEGLSVGKKLKIKLKNGDINVTVDKIKFNDCK